MPTTTKAELEEMLDQIGTLADDALTPRASRNELVDALQAIYDIAGPDDESDDDDEEDEDEEDEDEEDEDEE
jgi:hypothetical protein